MNEEMNPGAKAVANVEVPNREKATALILCGIGARRSQGDFLALQNTSSVRGLCNLKSSDGKGRALPGMELPSRSEIAEVKATV